MAMGIYEHVSYYTPMIFRPQSILQSVSGGFRGG